MENTLQLLSENQLLFGLLLIWSLFWKGVALWKASRKEQLTWFILILLINTLSILDIAYIFYLYKFELGSNNLLNFVNKQVKKFKH